MLLLTSTHLQMPLIPDGLVWWSGQIVQRGIPSNTGAVLE
jgi:hypothetical protein